ncbi:MAG: hypothetical protein K9K38_05630 [Rhodoferax sp.]|nr:hypothetical protein [Rhodoferax sp.]
MSDLSTAITRIQRARSALLGVTAIANGQYQMKAMAQIRGTRYVVQSLE